MRLLGSGGIVLAAVLATGIGCSERQLLDGMDGGAGAGGSSGSGGAAGSAGGGMGGRAGGGPAGSGGGPAGRGGGGGGQGGSASGGLTGSAGFGGQAGTGSVDGGPADAGPSDANPALMEVLSDFSIEAIARINMTGTPPRRGAWYSYNDMSTTCVQQPAVNALYRPSTPPTPSPGPSGGLALHAVWDRCTIWGAGISADLNLDEPSDGAVGTRLPYDISGFRGITFWAMTTPGFDNKLRFKVVRRSETPIRDGGACDETVVGVNKCLDAWGQTFTLPLSGTWQQITVAFVDETRFKQEGWGHAFPWDPTDVLGIQIQSQGTEMDQPFDFWIDDVYLFR